MYLFWDASGLAKRYTEEEGQKTVDALFAASTPQSMASTAWGYAETYSILLRRRNAGALSERTFGSAANQLRSEVIDSPNFTLLPITDEIVLASLAIIHKHNLNATDAAILAMLLRTLPSPVPPDFVLVAADKRLLRAANAEGMKTLDPAALPATDISAFLDALDAEALENVPSEAGPDDQEATDV